MITGPDRLCYADVSSREEADSFQKNPLGVMAVGLALPISTKS